MYEIKKGVPLPPSRQVGRGAKYPFLEMEVGDSFFHKLEGEDVLVVQRRLSAAAMHASRKTGRIFTTRAFEEAVGVWRLPDASTPAEPAPTPEPRPLAAKPQQPVVVNLRKPRGRPRKVVVHMEARA